MKLWVMLWVTLLLAGTSMNVAAQAFDPAVPSSLRGNNFEEKAPWQELENIDLPGFPKEENLIEFYVSAVATNKFHIDASTLSTGEDGVVRYVLVVKTSGGATNVSFEGIQCDQHMWKIYATGGSDGTWKKVRENRSNWRPIENKPINRHHSVLRHDLFCPMGSAVKTPEEGRNALRLGRHPEVTKLFK